MKANNLTICVPVTKCTRDCGFCISKMTPSTPHPIKYLGSSILNKALTFSKIAGVNSVLITARGEPLCDMESTLYIIKKVSWDYYLPCELQTNGDLLNEENIENLVKAGLDVFAISIDSVEQLEKQKKAMASIVYQNKVLRWTVILCDDTIHGEEIDYEDWIELARKYEVNQLSFRKLTIPTNPLNYQVGAWIFEHTWGVNKWIDKYEQYCLTYPTLRKLSFGPKVVDARGIALTYIPYCIEEGTETDEIRSLILR